MSKIFNEETLRQEIVKTWGEAGVHVEVFDNIIKRLSTQSDGKTVTDVKSPIEVLQEKFDNSRYTSVVWFDNLTLDFVLDAIESYHAQFKQADNTKELEELKEKLDFWEKANDRLQEQNEELRRENLNLIQKTENQYSEGYQEGLDANNEMIKELEDKIEVLKDEKITIANIAKKRDEYLTSQIEGLKEQLNSKDVAIAARDYTISEMDEQLSDLQQRNGEDAIAFAGWFFKEREKFTGKKFQPVFEGNIITIPELYTLFKSEQLTEKG